MTEYIEKLELAILSESETSKSRSAGRSDSKSFSITSAFDGLPVVFLFSGGPKILLTS